MSEGITPINGIMEFTERRKDGDLHAVLQLCKQMHDSQVELKKCHDELALKLENHMCDEVSMISQRMSELVTAAFPGGDSDGHRRHHEAIIRRAEEGAEFWSAMRKELGKWGLIGFMAWAAYNLWKALLMGPR